MYTCCICTTLSYYVCSIPTCSLSFYSVTHCFRGIAKYAMQLTKLRLLCNLLYADVNLYIINISSHPDEGAIKVRYTV